MIYMILCTDQNNGVGYKNTIPWYSKADFEHFKNTTLDKKILMGYNTWKSLPVRPLKNRTNIVVTRVGFVEESTDRNVIFIDNLNLIDFVKKNGNDLYIIGGPFIWNQLLPYVDVVIKSTIQSDKECDSFFDVHTLAKRFGIEYTVQTEFVLDDGVVVQHLYKGTVNDKQNSTDQETTRNI